MTPDKRDDLLGVLTARFQKNMRRHAGLEWARVEARLAANAAALESLAEMERTGGEPDVVDYDRPSGVVTYFDCSAESPKGRRSLCYDHQALVERKEHKPKNSAADMAGAMGVEILTEQQYRRLQTFGEFDTKTSSWLATPPAIRRLGGAIFGDRRYDQVFVYHNGAQSYYAARGFRGALLI